VPNFRMGPEPQRHYGPDDLGGLCEGCGTAIPAALAGMTRHPTCIPEWPTLLEASRAATARQKARDA